MNDIAYDPRIYTNRPPETLIERVKKQRQSPNPNVYQINGKEFRRVPFGSEESDWGADQQLCHDCGVRKGQLHVHGCDAEQCPLCKGQAISCSCHY